MNEPFPFPATDHSLPSGNRLAPLLDPADAGTIATMLVALEPWRALGYRCEVLTRYLVRCDPALHRFRILSGDALLGTLCVRYPWLRGPYIELVGIAPQARGRRLGSAILDWIEAQVRGQAGNLWACVSQTNEGGRRFYARHHFREVAPIDDLVTHGHAEILLRKRLPD